MSSKKEKEKKVSVLWMVIFLAALCVFCFAGYQLFVIVNQYRMGVEEYKQIAYETKSEETTQQPLHQIDERKAENGEAISVLAELPYYDAPCVDFDKLKKLNPDVIGWIELEAIPEISYPVVKGEDNSYYLNKTFMRASNSAGAIFVDSANQGDFSDCNTFIYGHNMKNGSMFGKLKQLDEKKLYKKSSYLWICTPEAKYRYEIFSIQYANVDSDTYTLFGEHNELFGEYLENMKEKSVIPFESEILNEKDRIVSLSTCTSNEQVRLVVQARWIQTFE